MNDLKEKIVFAGVVGAGGAGFPTNIKLSGNIETILINATECEPLLKTDFHILRAFKNEMIETLENIVTIFGAKAGVIGIKKHTGELLSIEDNYTVGKVTFKLTGDIYPAGDEIILIKETLDKTVPAGALPISAGIVVLNIETLYNIKNAMSDIPVTEKFVTVAGETDKTYVLKVPFGTPVEHIFASLGIIVTDNLAVLDGGPMMGKIINPNIAVVTKTTKGLLLIDKNTLCIKSKTTNLGSAINRASGNCCGCRMCTDMCPRYLMGYDIEPHKILSALPYRIENTRTFMGSFYCCNCGVCEIVACPQNISPNKLFERVKNELVKNGVKPNVCQSSTPRSIREYRKIPNSRFINRLGIKKYYRDEYEFTEIPQPNKVTVMLKQHIGAMAECIVVPNEKVSKGQLIAVMKDGKLGANISSPIDGIVFSCSENSVIILA
jgi:Na+-translocating ferredoxin:NAD+ oxidoreductase RnfC subunit